MATAVATVDEASAGPRGPSIIVQLGLLVALSAFAAGIGWLAGGALDTSAGRTDAEPAAHGAGGGHGEADGPVAQPSLYPLAGITTNLAAPSDIWLRLELALLFEGAPDAAVAEAVHQDLLAYLRTVKLHQIEGASGFQHLKTDLEERAAIRSEGKVSKVLIRTMLFE